MYILEGVLLKCVFTSINDIGFFSFFVECCALVSNRVLKDCLSVRYFGRKFHSQ